MNWYKKAESSWIIDYKQEGGKLKVTTVRGGEYAWDDPSGELFEEMDAAPSKGGFYHSTLKDLPHEKL